MQIIHSVEPLRDLRGSFLRPLLGLGLLFFSLALLVRLGLSALAFSEMRPHELLLAWLMGVVFDAAAFVYFAIPWVLALCLLPRRLLASRVGKVFLWGMAVFSVAVLLFVGVAEFTFWDEFGARFNFVAVDYLVYTHEVIGNIRQSYPVGIMLSGLAVATVLLCWVMRGFWQPQGRQGLVLRVGFLALWALLVAGNVLLIGADSLRIGSNRYADEIGRNGIFQFFAAYRSAELDYQTFYLQRDGGSAALQTALRKLVATPEGQFVDATSITRWIQAEGPEKRLNVVLISIESLSAEYMAAFGNQKNLTPNLDRLAKQSLFFTNLYATGNRTVRGLEALSLGVPPTPGESIVKRPHNEGLFTVASVLNGRGYESMYIYGGYSYFDNMRSFFSGNHYRVEDRGALKKKDIDHETIWGVADENLFTLALRNMNGTHARGKPFFAHVMTVSNHPPYTYPAGRIDIPSKSGRPGAVKYTDWAIGDFIRRAQKEPWFDNTVFLIVADHCASSAGRVDLPIERYHIPALIYSPKHVSAQRYERLASQIDLLPTLLGRMNMSYQSQFFGYDLIKLAPERNRAFIATYQSLGYLRASVLTVLSPQRRVVQQRPDRGGKSATPLTVPRTDLIDEAQVYFQSVTSMYRAGLLKEQPVQTPTQTTADI